MALTREGLFKLVQSALTEVITKQMRFIEPDGCIVSSLGRALLAVARRVEKF